MVALLLFLALPCAIYAADFELSLEFQAPPHGWSCARLVQGEGWLARTLWHACTEPKPVGSAPTFSVPESVLDEANAFSADFLCFNRIGQIVHKDEAGFIVHRDPFRVAPAPAVASNVASVRFLQPLIGEVVKTDALVARYEVRGLQLPEQGSLVVWTHKDKVDPFVLDGAHCNGGICEGTANIANLEPGTHGFSAQLVQKDGREVGKAATIVFDRVPLNWPEPATRRTTDSTYPRGLLSGGTAVPAVAAISSEHRRCPVVEHGAARRRRARVAYVGSLKFDGQKSIWRSQLRLLPRDSFDLTFVTFVHKNLERDTGFLPVLRESGVPVLESPLELEPSANWDEASLPVTSEEASIAMLAATRRATELVDGLYRRHRRRRQRPLAGESTVLNRVGGCHAVVGWALTLTSPPWAVRALHELAGALAGQDTVVFANSQSVGDALIVVGAGLANAASGGTTTVMDLPSLFPHAEVMPSVTVAPSHFAAEHHSVRKLPVVTVIPPGVNTTRFAPLGTPRLREACDLVVGFVGRLAAEKSVGMYVHAAALLRMRGLASSPRIHFCFRVVGGGEMELPLQLLARDLGVPIEFVGAVYGDTELPDVVRTMDVLVNPSLRSVAETFCIVNLEAMSLGIPVVSFKAGGVGEYLVPDLTGFEVSEAHPGALADAVWRAAVENGGKAGLAVGRAAREAVVNAFGIERTVERYQALYLELAFGKG